MNVAAYPLADLEGWLVSLDDTELERVVDAAFSEQLRRAQAAPLPVRSSYGQSVKRVRRRRPSLTRTFACVVCGSEFTARRSHARYCGASCRQTASQARRAQAA